METATNRKVKAVFRNGRFEPVEDVELEEGAVVEVVLPQPTRAQMIAAWEEFMGTLSHEDAQIVRETELKYFETIDEELWK